MTREEYELQRKIAELNAELARNAEEQEAHEQRMAELRAATERDHQKHLAEMAAQKTAKARYERSPAGIAEKMIDYSDGTRGQSLGDAIASMVTKARRMNGDTEE